MKQTMSSMVMVILLSNSAYPNILNSNILWQKVIPYTTAALVGVCLGAWASKYVPNIAETKLKRCEEKGIAVTFDENNTLSISAPGINISCNYNVWAQRDEINTVISYEDILPGHGCTIKSNKTDSTKLLDISKTGGGWTQGFIDKKLLRLCVKPDVPQQYQWYLSSDGYYHVITSDEVVKELLEKNIEVMGFFTST